MSSKEILIADDEITSRILLEETLRSWGYDVDVATDGTEAWDLLSREGAPRLAVLDWMMPGLDGPELCRRLKKRQDAPYTYAILLTSRSETEDIVEGLDAGADDFLSKPVDMNELRGRLDVGRRLLDYESALAEKNQQIETLIRAMPDLVCFKDAEGRILEINDAFLEILGLTKEECIGRTELELAKSVGELAENLRSHVALDREVRSAGRPISSEEVIPVAGKGNRTYDVIRVPLVGAEGENGGLVSLSRDITERKRFEERLREEATYDSLTGLANRRHFMSCLATAISSSRRYGHALSLCVCDIDKFKTVNDTYGHYAGDTVLSKFGELLRREVRTMDVAGRYGGDEFCVIFPETSVKEARISMDRVRSSFAELDFHAEGGGQFQTKASFGMVELVGATMSDKDFFNAADSAMYEAKRGGGNRIHVG